METHDVLLQYRKWEASLDRIWRIKSDGHQGRERVRGSRCTEDAAPSPQHRPWEMGNRDRANLLLFWQIQTHQIYSNLPQRLAEFLGCVCSPVGDILGCFLSVIADIFSWRSLEIWNLFSVSLVFFWHRISRDRDVCLKLQKLPGSPMPLDNLLWAAMVFR